MDEFVIDPLSAALGFHYAKSAATSLNLQKHDVLSFVKTLLIVWTSAAFGEEIGYRRYLLSRAAEVGNRTKSADWVGLVAVSVLFGIGHY